MKVRSKMFFAILQFNYKSCYTYLKTAEEDETEVRRKDVSGIRRRKFIINKNYLVFYA